MPPWSDVGESARQFGTLKTTEAMFKVTHNLARRALPLVCLAILALGACQRQAETAGASSEARQAAESETPASGQDKAPATPVGGEWRLVSIDSTELRGDVSPRIIFDDEGQCWGNTGINDFRSSFSTDRLNRLDIGPAAVTRKAGPPEAMAVEKLFLERLQSAVSFEVKGDLLYVNSGENRNVTFERIYP